MNKKVLAICDSEEAYVRKLAEYLQEKRSLPFSVCTFTSAEQLQAYLEEKKPDLLLVSQDMLDERVLRASPGRVLVLSDGSDRPELEAYPHIYKYQAASALLGEVMEAYGDEKTPVREDSIFKKNCRVIGVISPSDPVPRMLAALAAGQILAEEKPALYVCLEAFTGLEDYLEGSADRTVSDLLYFYRQGGNRLVYKMTGMLRNAGLLEVLSPPDSPYDLQEISGREWSSLFAEILRTSMYETMIIDIGNGAGDLPEILHFCTQILLVSCGNGFCAARAEQMEQFLLEADPEMRKKLQKLALPARESADEAPLRDLSKGSFGRRIRQLLTERNPDA